MALPKGSLKYIAYSSALVVIVGTVTYLLATYAPNRAFGIFDAEYGLNISMQLSADPCTDFYTYVCGTYDASPYRGSRIENANDRIRSHTEYILGGAEELTMTPPMKTAMSYYNICRMSDNYYKQTFDELRGQEDALYIAMHRLAESSGLPAWNSTRNESAFITPQQLASALIALKLEHRVKTLLLLDINVQRSLSPKDPPYLLTFGCPSKEDACAESSHHTNVFSELYEDSWEKLTKSQQQFKRVWTIVGERICGACAPFYAKRIEGFPKVMTLAEAVRRFPFFNFTAFVSGYIEASNNTELVKALGKAKGNYRIQVDTELFRALSTFVMGQELALDDWMILFYWPLRGAYMLGGQPNYDPCFEETVQLFGPAVQRLFIDGQNAGRTRDIEITDVHIREVDDYLASVRSALMKALNSSHSLPKQVKRAALLKATKMFTHTLAFAKKRTDDAHLLTFYAGLNVSEASHRLQYPAPYLQQRATIQTFLQRKQLLKLLRTHVDQTELDAEDEWAAPFKASGFVQRQLNSAGMSFGALNWHTFDGRWPLPMKFAPIAFFYGHELAHGFGGQCELWNSNGSIHLDTTGTQLDELGYYHPWLGNSTAEFEEYVACLSNQYREVGLEDLFRPTRSVNASSRMDENLADNMGGLYRARYLAKLINSGLALAYRAFLREMKRRSLPLNSKPLEHEPFADLTAHQLFFIGYGRMMCNGGCKGPGPRQETSAHTLPSSRVNVTVGNMPEFAKAFNCKATKPKRCDNFWLRR